MLRQIANLIFKEFRAIFSNKRSRMVILVPPMVQILVFGYAATFDINHVAMAVYNQDPGHASRDLIARFDGSPVFERVATIDRYEDIARLLDTQQALLVVHIDSDFTHNLATHQPASVQLIVDGRNSNTALIALNDAQEIVLDFNRWVLERRGDSPLPAVVVDRAWYSPNLLSRWFIIPGVVGLLTLVVTTMVTSLSIARERELGTFDQLLVTPMRPYQIIMGKLIPPFIIGMVEAAFIVSVAVFWFHVPLRGSLLSLAIGVACFLLSSIGVGLAISSISRTMQQGLLGAFMFLVPAVILSGFATPIANMPHLLQQLTLINPLRYYLVVLRSIFLQGATTGDLISQLWPMLLIGLFNLTVASVLFRRQTG